MKNAFYFILKALFAFEIFRLLSLLFGYVEKGLDKKAKINFNFFRVTDWTTKIAMHKLPNISRKKGNQKMWEKLVPGPFKKKTNLSISRARNVVSFVPILCLSRGLPKISKLKC